MPTKKSSKSKPAKSKSSKSRNLKTKSKELQSTVRDKSEINGERPAIDSVLQETRSFPPPADFRKKANYNSAEEYEKLWRASVRQPEKFWGKVAKDCLVWNKPFKKVLEWKVPFAKWFVGGKLNVSENCLDRHLSSWRRNKAALIWEGEPGDQRILTYQTLHHEVSKCANMLLSLGLKTGDCAAIYMPLVPELMITMLACARLGITHNVVFAGFSSEALSERINDSHAKALITADGGWRKGSHLTLKAAADEAVKKCPQIHSVVVVKRLGTPCKMEPGRDHWWHELMAIASSHCDPVPVDSEHPLFVLYTSGSTGKPKGILHTTAGYLTSVTYSAKMVWDLKEEDTMWCSADLGWVTGHSYAVYGPLSNGATVVMYEGGPLTPDPGRFWSMIERYRVSILYTAPTAIRAFIKAGEQWPRKYDLSSLRLLGCAGEPINPEAWIWYRDVIGGGKCPVVDTWWQTETSSIMISPVPGITRTYPGSASKPFIGIDADVVDKHGNPVKANQGGFLVIKKPWPSMLRTILNDPERYKTQYWSQIPGMYFTGDGARKDKQGNFWIMGRIDDVINVAGHRLSTMEIESALGSHKDVAESAVVGKPDEVKGEGIVCFVGLRAGVLPTDELKTELSKQVTTHIGTIARPDEIRFTDALPKTRSGKVMRRLLRDIAAGREVTGDTSTLEDLTVLARLRSDDEA